MSGWPVLDVAIGLVFVYVLLSLICTTINEGILTQLRARAKFLDKGILALLGSSELKREFFLHPLIESFKNPEGDSVLRRIGRALGMKSATADQCPSYLSAFVFARVVHDMMKDPETGSVRDAVARRLTAAADQKKTDAKDADQPNGEHKSNSEKKVQSDQAARLELSKTLRAVLAESGGPTQELALLKQWYDDGMDRVTGWYKRHAQAWVRVLAVLITLVMNADTIQITKRLWLDPTLRAKIVEAARTRTQKPPKAANYTPEDTAAPEETAGEVGSAKSQTIGDLGGDITESEKQMLGDLMGWDKEWEQREALKDAAGKVPELQFWSGVLAVHWLGWLLTMIAVSLGAPFWFDLLKRLMNIRNAGQATDPQGEKPGKAAEVRHVA